MRTSGHPRHTRRGRRPQTDAELAEGRARIVRATAEVFAEHGSRGTTVGRILEQAGISRPTFYRYFHNAEEPVRAVLDEANAALVAAMERAVGSTDQPFAKAAVAIDAYLDWCQDRGALLRPLYAELHDPASPVSAARSDILRRITALLAAQLAASGRVVRDPLALDLLLNAVEHAGLRLHLDAPADPSERLRARATMLRMVLAVIGTAEDWRQALADPTLAPADPPPAP